MKVFPPPDPDILRWESIAEMHRRLWVEYSDLLDEHATLVDATAAHIAPEQLQRSRAIVKRGRSLLHAWVFRQA